MHNADVKNYFKLPSRFEIQSEAFPMVIDMSVDCFVNIIKGKALRPSYHSPASLNPHFLAYQARGSSELFLYLAQYWGNECHYFIYVNSKV